MMVVLTCTYIGIKLDRNVMSNLLACIIYRLIKYVSFSFYVWKLKLFKIETVIHEKLFKDKV